MLRWFKRQSTGVQTVTIAVIAVILLVLIAGGGDDDASTTVTSPPPAVAEEDAMFSQRPRPPGPDASDVVMAFQQTGLPTEATRDTTTPCAEDLPGCVSRVTTDSVTVIRFISVRAAKRYAREFGRDARRNGATVVSYAAARTASNLRPQYAAVLDAVAAGGDGHAARRRVRVAQVRKQRERAAARRRAAARAAAQAEAERIAAATPPPAPEPEPVAAPDYSGLTCSEIGHSFNVTPGSDPDHDADGDGVACESE